MKEVLAMTVTRLSYVFDPYCGWCYGFEPRLGQLLDQRGEDLEIEVLPGGLFLDDRVVPMAQMGYIAASNERIAQLTGVEFGHKYQELVQRGQFRMDSRKAAAGFLALQSVAPDRAVEIAAAMQDAFYRDGQDLGDPQTWQQIATDLGLPAQAVDAALADTSLEEQVDQAFAKARVLGATSFPTLLIHLPDGNQARLGGPASTGEQLVEAFDAYSQLAVS